VWWQLGAEASKREGGEERAPAVLRQGKEEKKEKKRGVNSERCPTRCAQDQIL